LNENPVDEDSDDPETVQGHDINSLDEQYNEDEDTLELSLAERAVAGYDALLDQFVTPPDKERELTLFREFLTSHDNDLNLDNSSNRNIYIWSFPRRNFHYNTLKTIIERIQVSPVSEAITERTNGVQKRLLNCLRTRTKDDLLEAKMILIQNYI
jgi:hypothetical protein